MEIFCIDKNDLNNNRPIIKHNNKRKIFASLPLLLLMYVFLGTSISLFVFPTSDTWAADPELCGDGIDNDEDGEIDEGFDVGAACSIPHTNGFGTCLTGGTKQCTADKLGTECVLAPNVDLDIAELEDLVANSSSCFDDVDNDCDGNTDADDTACVAASELFCNGFDDDVDGSIDEDFGIGTECNVGVGQCARTGSNLCDITDATQQGTMCSASPGSPKAENTPGKFACTDGLDNDCDGLVDLDDPSCQMAEACDGLDNDGDGVIDNGFGDLGMSCSAGVGACAVTGSQVCTASGLSTQCNALAALPGTEGPTGPSCSDGIDNDCDGMTDDADPNCSSANIAVSCSLVPIKGGPPKSKGSNKGQGKAKKGGKPGIPPGTSCEGKYTLQIDSNVPQFTSAEIMGVMPDGSLVDFSPFPSMLPVQDGDELHLNSRIDPEDWKLDAEGRFTDSFAPVPLVRVTADTGQNVVEAFCSPIPWMNVDQPSGQGNVISASEGDVVNVVAPIPRVDPATIGIVIDGVEILGPLGINPATDFPTIMPLDGTVDINGQMVKVSELVVDVAPSLDELSSNVLTMTLENLGGGGHIVVINGDPYEGTVADPISSACHEDDVLAAGTVSVFGITIHSPQENEELPGGNTLVDATVDHGRMIANTQVHGLDYPVNSQTCGNLTFDAFGETFSVNTCTLNIMQNVAQTDLSMPLALGTFDVGQNILNIRAVDDLQYTTYGRRKFTSGIGVTVSPGVGALSPLAQARLEQELETQLEQSFANSPSGIQPLDIQVKSNGVDINLAFTFGITEDGVDGFFGKVCTDATDDVRDAVDEALVGVSFDPISIPVDGACDPTVRLTGLSIDMGEPTCDVDPEEGVLNVEVKLPDIDFFVGVEGKCKHKELGICISEVIVNLNLAVLLEDFGLEFGLTEDLVLVGGEANPQFITGNIDVSSPGSGVEINCLAGFLADVLNFFSFGLVDFEGDASAAMQNALDFNVDIAEALRANSQDPLEVQKIEINEQFVEQDPNADIQMEQEILQIKITDGVPPDSGNGGVTGTIGASFFIPVPEEEGIEATVMNSPAPKLPIPNVQDIFFAYSDDLFNLLFTAIGLNGAFTTTCVPGDDGGGNPLTIGDTLPADCNALVGADQFQTDVMIGRCNGAKGIDCGTLVNPGQAFICTDTQNTFASSNLSADTELLFCAAQPLAPRTLIKDNLVTAPVEAEIRPNDMQITIALDRDGDGVFDPNQYFPLAQSCLGFGDDPTKDCKWADACFDLNLATEFSLGTSTSGSSQIVRTVTGVTESMGMECAGGFNLGAGPLILTEAGTSGPVDTIQNNIQNIVNIFEATGLDLGGLVGLENPNMVSIDVPEYQDVDCPVGCAEYVGITGDLAPPP